MSNEKVLNRSYAIGLILATLSDGARHGYSISQEVEKRSDSRISLNDGTVYPLLRALEEDGLIESTWEQPKGERKRRIYSLNERGHAELTRQKERWREFAMAMDAVFEGPETFSKSKGLLGFLGNLI